MKNTKEVIYNQDQTHLADLVLRGKTWVMYWIVMAVFILIKGVFRPHYKDSSSEIVQLILFSFPNFAEAYIGTFTISAILVIGRIKGFSMLKSLKDRTIYYISVTLAAIYVISQELNLHSIGGENITDINDIISSVLGLSFVFIMLNTFGTGIKKRADL